MSVTSSDARGKLEPTKDYILTSSPSKSSKLKWSHQVQDTSTTSLKQQIDMFELTKESIPKATPSRSTRLTRQSAQKQPTPPISLNGSSRFEPCDQLIDYKEENTNNKSVDGDGGSSDCNQLLGATMGAHRRKGIIAGDSKVTQGQESSGMAVGSKESKGVETEM